MKLLIIANYAKEHINKFHLPTIKKFKDKGWQVDVACRADENIPFCDNVYDLPCSRNLFAIGTLKSVKLLKKIISDNKYDVVHCHTLCGRLIGTMAAFRFKKQGVKLFFSLHGLNYYKGSSFLSKFIIFLDRYMLKKADYIFSVNNEDLLFIKSRDMVNCRMQFCPVSINFDKFRPKGILTDIKVDFRNSYGIGNATLLTYVAEINKNKNQIFLLKVLRTLKKTGYNFKLLLVGPDHSNNTISQVIKRYKLSDQVILLGWRDDIYNILISSDIYVASSKREGFGVNIIEAMYCGLPVVASNNRGHREIIQDGVNGFLVDLDDVVLFAQRIKDIVEKSELKENIVKNSLSVIQDRFSFRSEDIIYDCYEEYFGENVCS